MVLVHEAVLLGVWGSSSVAVTVTVLVTVPGVVAVTRMVTVAVALATRSPRAQVTVPFEWLQLP
ncbi:MAG: hypothetical protein WD269_01685 [Acidimicrobiia bacterium]